MKKIVFYIAGLMLWLTTATAQSPTVYEKVGDHIKVTHYYDGTDQIRETGFFYEGKAHGAWAEYTKEGELRVEANYVNGKKEGTWFVWSLDRETLYQVDYLDNTRQDVRVWDLGEPNLHVKR